MRRLLLVRHGETAWNAESRWQGWADVPLSPVGEAQAKAAASTLKTALPDGVAARVVASSDLARALQTAQILADGLGLREVQREAGLRERNVGEWAGLQAPDIEARWPGLMQRWRNREIDAPPGGEGDEILRERVMASVNALLESATAEMCIVAVTHGGVISMVERQLGLEGRGTRNLGARWIHLDAGQLSVGESLRLASG